MTDNNEGKSGGSAMVPKEKREFSALDVADVSKVSGIPRGFIMLMGEPGKQRPFVLGEGLLFKGEKKGFRSIQVDVVPVNDAQGAIIGYEAKATLWPKFSRDDYDVIKKLPQDPDLARLLVAEITRPFVDIGSATVENIKMKSMIPYMRELASTRARNRVLRLFTACGLTSVEELDDAVVEELVEVEVVEEQGSTKPAGAPKGMAGTAVGPRKPESKPVVSTTSSASSLGGKVTGTQVTPHQEKPRAANASEPYGQDCPKCKSPLLKVVASSSGKIYILCEKCGVVDPKLLEPKPAGATE